ncbi:S-layer homology domain-containing protein [Paenibacillus wulumuqiensis]|uniref:S-layer homology domain-containing protein n=1 Tax=Paenibacillus wulumuqiensis TaxID=1567107 RepID=UPI000619EB3E|nr:S-layer homology domain-containing protein [Paenibacillus wulumuqiensis]
MFIRKWILGLAGAVILATPGSALAFDDLDHTTGREEIGYLQNHDILSGITDTEFQPEATLTTAQGVAALVKGLELNIDNIRFIKAPKASDYYTNIDDNAWYSSDMLIAHLNGLQLDADVDAASPMTRGQFATLLWQGVEQIDPDIHESGGSTGTLQDEPVTIDDSLSLPSLEQQILEQVIDSGIASLDGTGNFRPDEPITRAEAAVMLYNALELTGKTDE